MDSTDRPPLSSAGDLTPLPPPSAAPSPAASPSASRPQVPPLPPVGDFLRQVISLGQRSIAPALPVLVLLYFYRFGMGLWMVFRGDATSTMGYPDYQLLAVTWVVAAAAYLPLLVLVHTPFLPFQDAILRGERPSFFSAVKHVLELLWPYGISSLLQVTFIAVPATAVIVAAGAVVMSLEGIPVEARPILVLLAFIPAGMWVAFALFLLAFATPLLILDGRGPAASIRESFSLVWRNFGGLFWRFFVSVALLVLAMLFATFPSMMLKVVTSVAQQKLVGVEIARLFWDSAIGALAFPFSVAVLMVLYRSVVPSRAGEASLAAPVDPNTTPVPTKGETITTTGPYQFE